MDNFNLRKFLVENKLTEQSKLISEEFLFIDSQGDKVYKDEKGLYYIEKNPFNAGEKLYYDPDYPPYEIVRGNFGTKLARYPDGTTKMISGPTDVQNSSDLDFDDFLKKFPEVKDDNLAGEVYDIMQQQNGFDDYDDEEIVSFMNAASTWTDAEDVADYFDEPASDIGKLIASYYQEESGYEEFDDKWDNYLDYLFPQTERDGDDIDDYYID